MKVAVLLSTYNGEKYVRQQIETILQQKGDFVVDLYIRDDGSSDNTKIIVSSFTERTNVFFVESSENIGPAKSFLTLLNYVKGYDYYAFADQDDLWNDDKLKKAILKIEKSSAPTLYCANAEIVDEKLNSMNRNVYKRIPMTDFYSLSCCGGLLGCTMVFNKYLAEFVQTNELPSKIIMHDYYIAMLCVASGGNIVFDKSCVMKYRQHTKNTVGVALNKRVAIKRYIKSILRKREISISDQAKELMPYCTEREKSNWLSMIAEYKDSIYKTICLALSRRYNFSSMGVEIKVRLSILLRSK